MRIGPMKPQQALLIRPWTRSPIVVRCKAAFLLLSLGIQSQGRAGRATPSPDASVLVGKIRPALVVLVSLARSSGEGQELRLWVFP
jgi:hypothetical protein